MPSSQSMGFSRQLAIGVALVIGAQGLGNAVGRAAARIWPGWVIEKLQILEVDEQRDGLKVSAITSSLRDIAKHQTKIFHTQK